jgi:hypothetical protein
VETIENNVSDLNERSSIYHEILDCFESYCENMSDLIGTNEELDKILRDKYSYLESDEYE